MRIQTNRIYVFSLQQKRRIHYTSCSMCSFVRHPLLNQINSKINYKKSEQTIKAISSNQIKLITINQCSFSNKSCIAFVFSLLNHNWFSTSIDNYNTGHTATLLLTKYFSLCLKSTDCSICNTINRRLLLFGILAE